MCTTRKIAGLLYVGVVLGAILWQTGSAGALAPSFIVPSGQRQLFMDNYGIGSMAGLTRTMHQPTKVGAVIEPLPGDPDVACIQTRAAPAWDPQAKVWKIWDCSTPNDLHAQGYYCGGYYESANGLSWTRPVVGQVRRKGSYANNYIVIPWAGGYTRPDMAFYDSTETDPNRRFKVALPNAGVAVSPDGIDWSMVPGVPGVPSSDEYNFSFDGENHLYILTVKQGGPYCRCVYLSTSTDFYNWTSPQMIFHADAKDQTLGVQNIQARLADPTLEQPLYNDPADYNVDVYNMGVFRYEGLYVGMPAMFHSTGALPTGNTTGFHHIQLVSSRDLHNWKRLGGREAFIGPSHLGQDAYDLTQIIGPSDAIVRGDTLWFYYTGIKYRSLPPDADPNQGAICLAVLRRDGFISLDAGDQFGTLVTDPFVLSDEHLFVNLDAPTGVMYVQVLDEDNQVVATSDIITGNLPFAEVPWAQGSFADLLGEEISLRFRLFDGSLYSYAVGPLLGDANGDGLVDDLDLTALARHWQQAGGLAEGDFNDDGVGDELDLTVLAMAWPGGAGALDVSAVPEPGTLTVMALGALALLRHRKRTG